MWHCPYSRFFTPQIGLVLAAFIAATPLHAEEVRVLAPVVVTALGEESPADEVPGIVLQLDSETLLNSGAEHPVQSLNRLPGFNMHRNNGQEHLTAIRSPVLTGGAGAGSFLFLEDGIALRAAGFANVNALMEAIPELASSVEAIAGPASALYGSNAVHGLVNFISRKPNSGGEVYLKAGPHGLGEARFWLGSGALGGGFVVAHDDGWRDENDYDHYKTQWRYDYQTSGVSLKALLSATKLQQETASYVNGDNSYRDKVLRRGNEDPDAYRDASSLRGQMDIRLKRGGGHVFEVRPYFRSNEMKFLMHFIPSAPAEENKHHSLGLLLRHHWHLAGGGRLISGLESEWTKGTLSEIQAEPHRFASLPEGVHYDYEVEAVSVAGFTQALIRLGENADLHLGLRAEQVFYDYDNHAANDDVGRYRRIADRSDEFFALTPKLGVSGHLSNGGRVFFNFAASARAPQTSDLYRLQVNQEAGAFKTERLESLELGFEKQVGAIQGRLVFYHMRKRNFHFRDADGFNVPDGRTRHSGMEAGLDTVLDENWRIALSAEYTEHLYDFSRVVSAERERITKGDSIDSAPELQARAALIYTRPGLLAELVWEHQGRYFTNAANTHTYPGHDLAHLHIALDLSHAMKLRFHIFNLADTLYATRADYGFGGPRYFPGERRTARLALQTLF